MCLLHLRVRKYFVFLTFEEKTWIYGMYFSGIHNEYFVVINTSRHKSLVIVLYYLYWKLQYFLRRPIFPQLNNFAFKWVNTFISKKALFYLALNTHPCPKSYYKIYVFSYVRKMVSFRQCLQPN